MASIVKIKRSSVQGRAPTTSNLETGELALNTRDGKLFSANSSTVFEIGANVESSHIGTLTVGNTSPYTFPVSDGTNDQVLATDGNGNLIFKAQTGGAVPSTLVSTSYHFTANTNQTTFNGTDNQGTTLGYDIGRINVYLNGIRLYANVDFTATNGSSIVLADGVSNNDLLTVDAIGFAPNIVLDDEVVISANTRTSTSTSQIVLDTFSKGDIASAQYNVQARDATGVHFTTVNVTHHANTAFLTEFGTIISNNSLMTLDAVMTPTSLDFKVTPSSSGVKITSCRTSFKV
jgi:hypothetical protein